MKQAKTTTKDSKTKKKIRPALTPEARENQLIALATDLVEQRLINGTASSQETTHFLKLGSTKNRLEMKKLEEENKLLTAKTKAMKSQQQSEEMYKKAIEAFRTYAGSEEEVESDEEE